MSADCLICISSMMRRGSHCLSLAFSGRLHIRDSNYIRSTCLLGRVLFFCFRVDPASTAVMGSFCPPLLADEAGMCDCANPCVKMFSFAVF